MFEALLFEAAEPPYRRIAEEAERLRALNLSFEVIAAHFGVSDKTVAKALAWIRNRLRN